ncbi:Calcineurin-like phosphoesterase [Algoriphagus boritolerans DSM 17298 = JCM 18970]|uniref:Calcineurin-like phosphoesterase n=3 Tax=Algoriphagus TaxID=246875 RepID=A0A1H5XGR2_9BACT|nr:Calcineurin-like phosphoesterase [Algoriphagus boritolerans DSM 17298 = JCM 18970]
MLVIAVQVTVFGQNEAGIKVAFLADIHLQDVYGDFQSEEFRGVINPRNGKLATIRTMSSQLNSTRLFNENYFALLAALEDLRQKGIKLVVLPGDYTDDGQPMNILGLKKILKLYSGQNGMRFFITTGNHDPVSPFGSPGGKSDFLGENGQTQAVFSLQRTDQSSSAISAEIRYWGYFEICEELKDFGFSPGKEDLFWTHPFIPFDYEGYDFQSISEVSSIRTRLFPDPKSGLMLPDASYLVEPVEGLWLLALDGNVYSYSGVENQMDSVAWRGSSIGFNLASKTKAHQLQWISRISQEAKKRGKTLVSFSHYPLADFHNGASADMKKLFGAEKLQLTRVPDEQVSKLYSRAGIRVHFAGHMHINDTGSLNPEANEELINIQVPSLAAFPPAYKIMNLKTDHIMEVKTQLLQKVDRFDEFFDLYKIEHQWLSQKAGLDHWDLGILDAVDYLDFTQQHLQELIRLRFLKSDWPGDLGVLVNGISQYQLAEWLEAPSSDREKLLDSYFQSIQKSNQKGPLMEDFYLIKNGGDLSVGLIPTDRMEVYRNLEKKNLNAGKGTLNGQFADFLSIFGKLCKGLPSDEFFIDLVDLSVKRVD